MKAKLIKTGSDYLLRDMGGNVLAITNGTIEGRKLSKQNCDEIFGIIDVEKLSEEYVLTINDEDQHVDAKLDFIAGFNKAMELNKYTEEDIMKAYDFGSNALLGVSKNNLIQSLQQPTEIEIDIEMKKVFDETKVIGSVKGFKGSGDKITTYKKVTKLDSEGCLILKKI